MQDVVTLDASRPAGETPGWPRPFGESLAASIEGRRVLMLARDPATMEVVETALRDAGVPVQTLVSTPDGFEAGPLETVGGEPRLPSGVVVVSDTSSWRSSFEALRANRAMKATLAVIDASRAGSADDHLLMVSREDALEDAARVMNLLMDRMVEADIEASGLARSLRDSDGYKRDMAMDRLFGDDVIARERAARMTIVCEGPRDLHDFDVMCVRELPAPGFDHRAVNEAFNRRTGGRGARGDRRTNRGGRGRR